MNKSPAEQPPQPTGTVRRPARSRRSRRRLIVFFIGLFCLVPVLALYLSSSFPFGRGLTDSKPAATAQLDSPGNPVVPALPGLPNGDEPETGVNLALTKEEAILRNAAVPESSAAITPAKPFVIPPTVAMEVSRNVAIKCLTSAIYYEAASETAQGQRAVAQVVLNRVRHPAYPNNICGVVFQGSERTTGCQFSFTCDGSLARKPNPSIWKRAEQLAAAAMAGKVEPSVGTATHYHTVWIVPYWAKSLDKVKTVGAHIFYRWTGYWGTRGAFSQRYVGEDLSDEAIEDGMEEGPIDYEDSLEVANDVVTYTQEPDPILTPGFKAAPPAAALQPEGQIIADEGPGTLNADNDKGTLILD